MSTKPGDKRAQRARVAADVAHIAYMHLPAPAQAMATASRLYDAQVESDALPDLAAEALAAEPGQMCLVSLGSHGGEGLRPVAISHVEPSASRHLRRLIDPPRGSTPPDAFSRAVVRSGGPLRMNIMSPRQLRLWFPPVYWAFAEAAAVCGILAAPLVEGRRAFGAVLLWRERDQPAFNDSNEAYVVNLARRLAVGLVAHPLVAAAAARIQL